MKVALGAARGLSFLHEAEEQVIYRDFKASNILLDGVRLKLVYQNLLHFIILRLVTCKWIAVYHTGDPICRSLTQSCLTLVWPKQARKVIKLTHLQKLLVLVAMLRQNMLPQVPFSLVFFILIFRTIWLQFV